ncbi:MAG TPA: hypothetical protein VFD87_03805, partial [Phototrophicaceae bacterium]|nr:hypothetical protein [Phototrophicaceae bacterium]
MNDLGLISGKQDHIADFGSGAAFDRFLLCLRQKFRDRRLPASFGEFRLGNPLGAKDCDIRRHVV